MDDVSKETYPEMMSYDVTPEKAEKLGAFFVKLFTLRKQLLDIEQEVELVKVDILKEVTKENDLRETNRLLRENDNKILKEILADKLPDILQSAHTREE